MMTEDEVKQGIVDILIQNENNAYENTAQLIIDFFCGETREEWEKNMKRMDEIEKNEP